MLACSWSLLPAAEEKPRPLTFDRKAEGKLPAGWKATQTNEGKGSVWKVLADKTAPSGSGHVLAQTASGPSRMFNLCVLEKSKFGDGEVSVRVKAVKGKIDQGGGIVWRYRDPENYYVVRFNPLEDNFRVYKVFKGKRIQLDSKEGITVPAGKWFQITVQHAGNRIVCLLDGKHKMEVKDDTFKEPGQVGLWSKADAVSNFDELTIWPKKSE
jgi:hypothetical protein